MNPAADRRSRAARNLIIHVFERKVIFVAMGGWPQVFKGKL